MASARKVIISCAVTGAIHTPSMSPHLPVGRTAIAQSAIEAAKAGAAIVHMHARNEQTGEPDQSVAALRPIVETIRQQSDCIVNITTGGAPGMALEERVQPAATLKPELASLNMGTMNFVLDPMLKRHKEFAHPWERTYLEGSRGRVFKNTYADIDYILATCAENGTRFELECYDIGHLYTLAYFADRGAIKPPFFVQSIFGILGGIGTHPEDVAHMRRTADRLLGDSYQWSVIGGGRSQMNIAALALTLGGHVRIGLEDSLWAGPGVLAESNAQQVRMARQLIEGLGLEVATPADAREMLQLKGGDQVAF